MAGPYTAPTADALAHNVERACSAGDWFLLNGYSPFVPHAMSNWQSTVNHDEGVWLELDFAWLEKCDVMYVIARSPGVNEEIKFCEQHGIPYFFTYGEVNEWRDTVWTHPQWMNEKPLGDPRFHKLLVEIGQLHDQKQADYGSDVDPFANVRGSEDWGIPGWVGALVRGHDKIKRLQTYAKTGTLANEGARDSFLDLAVYALIGLVLWEEKQ